MHPQQDGRFYVGFAPRVGRVDGGTLAKIADLAEAAGSDRVRTTAEQKLIVLDVAQEKVEELVASLASARHFRISASLRSPAGRRSPNSAIVRRRSWLRRSAAISRAERLTPPRGPGTGS